MNTPDADLRARMVEAAKDAFADETTVGDKGPIRLLTDGRNPWRALDDALAAAWAEVEPELARLREQLRLANIDAITAAAELNEATDDKETQ